MTGCLKLLYLPIHPNVILFQSLQCPGSIFMSSAQWKISFFKASSFYPFLLCEGVNDRELSSSWNRLLSRLSCRFCKTLNYHGMHYCLPVVWGAVSRHLMFSVVQLVSEGSQVIGRGSRHVTACDCGRCRSGPGTPPTVGLSCLNPPPPTSTRLTHQKQTIFFYKKSDGSQDARRGYPDMPN